MERLKCTQLLAGFRDGSISVISYAERMIQRQKLLESSNYFTVFDAEVVRQQARDAQAKYDSGSARPLEGLPIVFKDNISIVGEQNSGGTKAFWGRQPKTTAPVAQKLLDAGIINTGRANMHELAWGTTSNNGFTGPVRNFWNLDHNCGGSSGGSGAVVAADIVPVALGTDTGGSIRIPASACGVVGYRPSINSWPSDYGLKMTHLRDSVGPLARNVNDIAFLDTIVTGNDHSVSLRPENIRIGVPRTYYWEDVDEEVRRGCDAFLERLGAAGFQLIQSVSSPDDDIINNSVGRSVQQINYELLRTLKQYIHANGFDDLKVEDVIDQISSPDVKRFFEMELNNPCSEYQYNETLKARDLLIRAHERYAKAHSLTCWIFPAIKFPPPRLDAVPPGQDDELDGATSSNADVGSICDHPGITMPAGRAVKTGVPFGIEIDGLTGSDRTLIDVALAIERAGVLTM